MSSYPYSQTYDVLRGMPSEGRSRETILEELRTISDLENQSWESGQCSGTMYCGDHEHYAFMDKAFSLFAHVNALQRDICPSMTRFEGEIIAMTLDMLHGDAVTGTEPVGLITSGGSGSILHAMTAYREQARASGATGRLNVVKPETGHPAFDKACHLLDMELRVAPTDPETTQVVVADMASMIDDATVAIVGSACNYGYGTIDAIDELSDLAVARSVGLHVDGCLGGFILPFGEQLGFDIPIFDFRLPGVTTISADTHKYGYGFKGSSVLAFRDKELRNSQYFFQTGWSGGKYLSPGIDGSRSGGLLAATWAGMVSIGREGYLGYAKKIFDTAYAMQDAIASHPELRIMGTPSFCFSFTSDEFDIYHINDFMRTRGWRFNGQQYPNAIHMAVTRPQTADGVVERFAEDLANAVAYAKESAGTEPETSSVYGGVVGGLTDEADEFIRTVMSSMMDEMQALPPVN